MAGWGYTDITLKSDGEPSILKIQRRMSELRKHATIPENPPAFNAQSNGCAERAVQEVTAQTRCLKLGLESRIKVPVKHHWRIVEHMVEHAAYLISRCLRGADGKTPIKRLKGYESSKPMVEFGE